jgi:hypothetical protein
MQALTFLGKHFDFLHDTTPELDLEGARNCGKTILCLWKELEALKTYPGMWSYIGRYSDDATQQLLRPELERVAEIHGTDLGGWNRNENCYELPTGSRIFSFGLRTQSPDPDVRYKKIRGMSVSRIYVDQAEELPGDIASELRFPLRPDIKARVHGHRYPRQLTFSPNPADTDSWLARQFPTDNRYKGRRYYSLSLFDNAHNLEQEQLDALLLEFPPEHPKHATLILGQRGPTIIGDAIYDKLYDRKLHRRDVDYRPDADVLESFEVGKHNPFWVIAQRTHHGGLTLLGGIKGERLMLEDFLPIVLKHRSEWIPRGATIKTCTGPMGDKQSSDGSRQTLVQRLRSTLKAKVEYQDHANAPDVQLTMIEELSGLLRRRLANGEQAFTINARPDRWLVANSDGIVPKPFMSYALEGGYVWSAHDVSVSHDRMRKPKDDGDYANAMRCVEHILLNFCVNQATQAELDAKELERLKAEAAQRLVVPYAGPDSWLAF